MDHDEFFDLPFLKGAGRLINRSVTVSHHSPSLASPLSHHRFCGASVRDDRLYLRVKLRVHRLQFAPPMRGMWWQRQRRKGVLAC